MKRVLALLVLFAAGCDYETPNPTQQTATLSKTQSIECAFDVDPQSLIPMTDGQPYTSGSDLNSGVYPSFLYDGQNDPPAALRAKIDSASALIQPIGGKIRIVYEGMSNTRDEFDQWIDDMDDDPDVNGALRHYNESKGKCDLSCWASGGGDEYTSNPDEVQVVVFKHSNNRPQSKYQSNKRFPGHANTTKSQLVTRFGQIISLYPNVKVIVASSMAYMGWSCDEGKYGEPVAYEEGFALKWAIEEWNNSGSPVPAMWGPYVWDKTLPRDFYKDDGRHPESEMEEWMSDQFMDFFKTEPALSQWFLDDPTPITPPAAPSGLLATEMGTDEILITWNDNANNESGFDIERHAGSGNFAQIASAGANTETYSDTGLDQNTTYTYRVRAQNSAGSSAYSNEGSATTDQQLPPTAPSNLVATAQGQSAIDLVWQDNSSNEDGFKLERSSGGAFVEINSSTGASYSDTGLAAGTLYSYRVKAFNGIGESSYSNTASATTDAPVPTYTLTVNTVGSGNVNLDPDNASYDSASVVLLTSAPDPGWQFDGWSGAVTGNANPAALVMDGNKSVTSTFSEVTNPSPVAVYQINSGGPDEGDFEADNYYSGGSTYNLGAGGVYNYVRGLECSYSFILPDDDYTVKLHFIDTRSGKSFDVEFNGDVVLDGFDISDEAGGTVVPHVVEIPYSGADLLIEFKKGPHNPVVAGIEIWRNN